MSGKRELHINYDYFHQKWKLVEYKDGLFIAVLFVSNDIEQIKQKMEEYK